MGLVLPLAAVLALGIWLAWTFGGNKGKGALQLAIRKGAAGTLLALAAVMIATGKLFVGVPLIVFALSLWRPRFLERGGRIIDGRVTSGRFSGRRLDELAPRELAMLHAELAARPGDRLVLEAYLDRRMPGWRENVDRDAAGGPRRPTGAGTMTDEQAYQILGLAPGATEAEVSAAYRRLMKRVHPDQGGSTFLAAQINEAKERLLGRHR
ncbi:DnaJ domain-containing protein [Kaistia soli DSM 19436]|uniref:DnaJ domain-containing protein n=1 Tax=Kaistia soli DSM 19436 TaxID=1122133 RepID=A0A1M5H0X8_9HYPH|nr:DnaJ domain-containing protein [Kaistia soli]SHG09372.1 DnaJ domain-containing protein [Kaistia soli DSM 19436]